MQGRPRPDSVTLAAVPARKKHPARRTVRRSTPRNATAVRTVVARRHARTARLRRERALRWQRRAARGWNQLRATVRRWWLTALIAGSALAMVIILFSPLLQVREIRVSRKDARLDVEAVLRALQPLFGRHLLLVTAGDAEARIRSVLPDVAAVRLKRHAPSRLAVTVEQEALAARITLHPVRQEAAGTGAQAVPAAEHHYLTVSGLYVRLPIAASGALLPEVKVTDIPALPQPGTRLVPPELLTRMREAERILTEEFGAAVPYRTIHVRAREFHLSVGRWSLWFDLTSPLSDQLSRYRTFLQSPGVREASQYVDLRLAGMIVYR